MSKPIYLDHNATTPLLPQVLEAMRACWSEPQLNPGSPHAFGRRARRVLEDARDRVAELLGARTGTADADRVVWTSGGTEANNLAVLGLAMRRSSDTKQLVVSAIEHSSIGTLAENLQRRGWRVDRLGVDRGGTICVNELPSLLRCETAVVAAMLAQNETGVLQPVADLAAICAKHEVPLHTDAVQVAGKLPIDFRKLGAATMSIAAHKFNGPLGIGAMVVRHGVELQPQLFGGHQQEGLRPGTEPVALAVGMCRALELWHEDQHERVAQLRRLRDRFELAVLAGWPQARIVGAEAKRLPNTSQIAFVGLDRQALFMALDLAGVACSAGSACASGSSEPSPVLVAMDCDNAVVSSALRFSMGISTSIEDVDEAVHRILRCCNHLGRQKPR